jgi:nucleoside-diphosphate-sugar epimerase
MFVSTKQGDMITEDTPPAFDNLSGKEYAKTKLLAYQEAMHIKEQGLSLLVFIPGIIFGQGMPGTVSFLEYLYAGKMRCLPDIAYESGIPLVYRLDLLQAIVKGVERNKFGEKYIVAQTIPIMQLIALLSEIMGKEMNFKLISYRRALVLAWLVETYNKLTGGTPRITVGKVKSFFTIYAQQFDTSKARNELDWTPTPLKEACKDTVDWFSKNCVT